ncbi:hypothetical protein KM043_001090 [Ampulex compressa]|nr:hypothetical protein KM043_001090 [Ampulex compressa]
MAFSFRVGTNWCHDFPKLARESGFYFNIHRPRVRVDWNRIGNIDIERVIQERDFSTIDENINNVIDYCWESEYDVKILDTNFVKLFRLAQLAVEYLLYCKQYLDHSVVILKDELRLKIEENVQLKREMKALEDVIKRLKEKSRDTYKLVETKICDSSGEILKCPHCPKTFISALFVNAHIARRHPYISDMHLPLAPAHDHYRVETEKLHEEIKTLKERLNETERVIRNESYGIPDNYKVDYEKRTAKEDLESLKYTVEETEKAEESKGYQEEINNLKSVLLDEIKSLKQKEKSMREMASETNVQMLMNQQEREIQKLREQVFQKFTPDIESMHIKLRAQEDYWKSKMEHLEQQHRQDIEKLTTELKLTQKTAERTKSEYESKVSDLEKQSMDQSSILQEQSNRLNSLTREINNSQAKNQQPKTTSVSAVENIHESMKLEYRDKKNTIEVRARNSQNLLNDNIIMEDVDSLSSRDSDRLAAILPRTRFIKKSVYTASIENNIKHDDYNEDTDQRQLIRSKNLGTAIEEAEECIRNCKFLDKTSTNHLRNFQTHRFPSNTVKDVLSNELKSSPKRNSLETFSSDVGNGERLDTRKVIDLSSETESEPITSDSRSESDSQDAITLTNGKWLQEHKSHLDSPSLHKSPVRQVMEDKGTKVDPFQIFEQKLKDLGIDPEWQGIPSITFKQKMDLVKHHQNISSKKIPKYNQARAKILNEVLQRLSARYKNKKNFKPEKNPAVVSVKPRITKVVAAQRTSESESQPLAKAKAPHPLQRYQNKLDIPNGFDTTSTKAKIPLNDSKAMRSAPSYTPTLDESPKQTNNVNNPGESTIESFSNSLDRSKSILGSPGHKSTPLSNHANPIPISSSINPQFLESNDPDDLIARQESTHESFMSPKNRSVLKSTSGSTGSLAKKKRVNFDLEDDKEDPSSLLQEEEINDYPWKAPDFSTEGYQPENRSNTSNIVLKTSQSEKIAEISRKIEAQLSMARRQPVGAVETMFLSGYMQEKQKENDDDQQISSSSITSSLLGSPVLETLSSANSNSAIPQPAPRHLKEKESNALHTKRTLSFTDNSDLESDIDEILKA